MTTYGAVPTRDPELADPAEASGQPRLDERPEWRKQLGEALENQKVHLAIIALTLLDAVCVLFQILYTFLHECQMGSQPSHNVKFLVEAADVISQGVTCLFLLELVLAFVAFGPRYYLPGWPHWKLHILDVVVVVATFVFDIVLHGKEREVAELLIILRLWRVVRIVEATVMSVSFARDEADHDVSRELEDVREAYDQLSSKLEQETRRRMELEKEVERLKAE